jgi:carboxyl-terminal processing protease
MEYNNNKRAIIMPLVISMAIVVGMFAGRMLSGNKNVVSSSQQRNTFGKLDMIINMVDQNYVDTVDSRQMVEDAIPALLKHLDPHTVYIPAKDFENVNQELRGNFGGIGVQFIMYNDTVAVVKVVPGGPSEKAGLIDGDRIVKVNDTLIAGVKMDQNKIMSMMRGQIGTKVKLAIKRKDHKKLINKNLVRGSIPLTSVDVAYMMSEDVGYIKVNKFAMQTYQEFMNGITSLREKGMKKLVVDLRGNQGGYMGAAVNMINEFLPEKSLIVFTKGKAQPRSDYMANGKGDFQDVPMVVLIDEGSASASEIFAGAIQDNDRGTIVGRRSFGKGLVQEQRRLPDGSALRLTVSRYHSPSGRCIQRPYDKGKASYYGDIAQRFAHGEFSEKDSIHLDTNLKYKTIKGRTVYGGGGITPDFFVPIDTNGVSDYLRKLVENNIIYRFSFSYVDSHRKEMKELKDYKQILSYLSKKDIISEMVRYASVNGVKKDNRGLKEAYKVIDTRLKAYIARHLIDDPGFYPIIRKIDNTLNKAYNIIEKSKLK